MQLTLELSWVVGLAGIQEIVSKFHSHCRPIGSQVTFPHSKVIDTWGQVCGHSDKCRPSPSLLCHLDDRNFCRNLVQGTWVSNKSAIMYHYFVSTICPEGVTNSLFLTWGGGWHGIIDTELNRMPCQFVIFSGGQKSTPCTLSYKESAIILIIFFKQRYF